MNKKVIAISAMMVAVVSGIAQVDSTATKLDQVLISADSKFELKRKDSGKPVIKITRADIEAQAAASLAVLLNLYAGIEMNGARSNAGQNLGYFIRGGSSRQVSFLIDGAQVSDASNISNEFDIRLVDVNQIEEIEILKGAASTLYGANASTAVVNIKLRKNPKAGVRVTVSSFIGTNKSVEQANNGPDEFNNSVELQGTAKNGLTYGIGFNHQATNGGLSATEAPDGAPANEPDDFNRINLLGRIGYDNRTNFKLTSYVSFDEFTTEFDDFSLVDADNETYNRQVRWGTNMNWKYSTNGELVYVDVSTHTRRDTRSSFSSIFNADGYSLDLYNKYTFNLGENNSLKTIIGFNFRTDRYEDFSIPSGSTSFEQNANRDNVNAQIYDPYMNVVYISDFGLNVNAGVRYNAHSNYSGQLVYHINPSYRFDVGENVIKVYGSYSTAYITPSLFQLYASSFGNEELEPEDNATLEGGFSWTKDQSTVTLSVFQREEDNLVQFLTIDAANFISQYQNVDEKLIAKGIELSGQTTLFDKLMLTANYSFTERNDQSLLRRIPNHKINASARIQAIDRGFITLRYQYNDDRGDAFFNNNTFATEQVVLSSYQTVDVDMSYGLKNKPVTFFAGINNLTDVDFQEIFGFQTRGRTYKVGVRLSF